MLRHFLRFELRFWLTGWMVWIFAFVIGAMIMGAVSSDNVSVGGAIGNTNRNAPFVIQNLFGVTSVLTLLMTTAFVNSAAIRDFQHSTHQILFSLPIRKWDYLLGRFLGSSLAALIPALGVTAGVLVAPFMPWADSSRFGPTMWSAHLEAFALFTVPNTLFIAAILFALAVLFRSTTVSFLAALLLLVAFGVADVLTSDMKNEKLAALLEPFGARAFGLATKYWTPAERNTLTVGLDSLLVWNRLIWLSLGLLIFGVTGARVSLSDRASRKTKPAEAPAAAPAGRVALPVHRPSWSGSAALAQFLGTFKVEFKSLIRTPTFVVVTAAAILNCTVSLMMTAGEAFGNKTFPVTYAVTMIIQGSLYLFLIVLITYFAGQLIWKEREDRVDEIQDSLPVRDWTFFAAKFSVLLASLVLILLAALAAGISVQAYRGYTRFQLPLYLEEMFFRDFSALVFLATLAFFFHVVASNKYLGYFGFIGYLIFDAFGWRAFDVGSRMVDFGSRPSVAYSDFFHFQPGSLGWHAFSLYWTLFCALLVAASIAFWRRGKESAWRARWRVAQSRLNSGLRPVVAVLTLLFVASAGWTFYNTKILNTFVTEKEGERRAAAFEKAYKQFESLAQPRITAVRYDIDLYPEKRGLSLQARQTLTNPHAAAIGEVHVTLDRRLEPEIKLAGASVKTDDRRLGYRIYTLDPPLAPGESRELEILLKWEEKGFANSVEFIQINQNGTFFNNTILPQIGYQPQRELNDRNQRRKQGLEERPSMPALERDCTANCLNTYISNNSDWVSVETVIRTAADQIAIAPGSLVREWAEDGRRAFHYKLDKDSLNFYSFLSARYEVAREKYQGLDLEVYHHPEHSWNVPRMLESMRKSIDYFTANFGPYYHKQVRIIEFPRVASFAQAFPGTMPYSESVGFIADLRDPESIDHVFYIVAHEIAHQWWAHQVIGANMQGATALSETLAQYSSLMVMEKEYGRDQMRKFLEYEMDRYLRSRGTDVLKEKPLLRVEAAQGYIHYQKGSLVMYLLKEMIGEEAVNRALRQVIGRYAYAAPPHPTSWVLLDALRAETPEEYQSLLTELFEEIVLFSNRTMEAKAVRLDSGEFEVTLTAEARKFKADEEGAEAETPVNDWIEIGAFAEPEKGKKFGKTLYRERIKVKETKIVHTFRVPERPARAGIDPFHLLVDRVKDDNLKDVAIP